MVIGRPQKTMNMPDSDLRYRRNLLSYEIAEKAFQIQANCAHVPLDHRLENGGRPKNLPLLHGKSPG